MAIPRITALYIGRVGDVIVSTPFLRALRRRYPHARIRFLMGWRSAQVAPLLPFIDEWDILDKPACISQNITFAWHVLTQTCDVLVDLNSSFSKTSTIISRLIRADTKLAFDKEKGPKVFNRVISPPALREHMSDRYRRLSEALGAPYDADLELRLPSEDVVRAREALSGVAGFGSRMFKIAIHPGNFDRFSFRWPEEKFVALADRLNADAGIRLYFLSGPGEYEKVSAIARSLKRPVPVLPPARLGVCGAMLKEMDLFVCNITGTTHLAAALGVPTFGFYAGYTQAVWRPRGARHGGTVCPEWESCRETSVDEAFAALRGHIDRLKS